ncbi:MAG: DUF2235 domain-containing protein [Bacteroidia bacterium]
MKRIVTCSDGTWNKPNSTFEGKPVRTNVQKIFDYVNKKDATGVYQLKYYDEGVGAEGNFLSRSLSGATGRGIDENIMDAYKFIVWNYEPGDEIWLFGFSRGAYTARSLGGMIRKCGIIKKSDLNLIEKAYKLYRNTGLRPESDEVALFRETNCYEPFIKFIGVWDTVGALGVPLSWFQMYNKKKYQFHDTTLSSKIDNAFHALAIDEKRRTFRPTLWQKSANSGKREIPQVLEQRWFAGVHSNVGGGYPDERLGDISLKWMLDNARAKGLSFDEELIGQDVKPGTKGKIYNSRTGIFRILPPYNRKIETDTKIDDSVRERIKSIADYRPVNIQG